MDLSSAGQLPKIKYYIVVGTLTIAMLFLYDFFIGKNYGDTTTSWQRNLNVSQTFFPLIFGYFLDRYGRKNCMIMLFLSVILPGLIITLLAFFTRTFDFVRVGMLLLGAAYQSITVAIITGLFAWTGNIFVYILAVTVVRMLCLVNDMHVNEPIPSDYDKVVVSVTLSLVVVLMVMLWWLEVKMKQQPVQVGKSYMLNIYFLFSMIQSFNSCISDMILHKITHREWQGGLQDSIPFDHNIGSIVCYGTAFIILSTIFFRKNLTLMVLTFLADMVMSFAILMLVLLNGTNSFTDPTKDYSTYFMKPAINLLSLSLTSTAGYIFLATSLTIVLKSTINSGIAVGASISVYRLTLIILSGYEDLMVLIWMGLTALLIQKMGYFFIGFYDTKRFRIMFREFEEVGVGVGGTEQQARIGMNKFRSDSSASIVINGSYA